MFFFHIQKVVSTLKSLKPDDDVEKTRLVVDLEKHRLTVEVLYFLFTLQSFNLISHDYRLNILGWKQLETSQYHYCESFLSLL